MTKYAVTAATGRLGQTAVKELVKLVGGANVVVIARSAAKAEQLFGNFGVTVRQADYADVDQMTQALTGVDKVLFISVMPGGPITREQLHANVVTALQRANVKFVAYTSYPHIESAQAPLADDHRATEQMLTDAHIAHSFLRNNWYLENQLSFIQTVAAGKEALYWGGNTGWALERDYAEAAAKVLTLDHPQAVYEFAGPILSFAQLADQVAAALATTAHVKKVSQADYAASLQATGMDEATANLLASFDQPGAVGDLAHASDDLAAVLGRPVTPIATAVKEIL